MGVDSASAAPGRGRSRLLALPWDLSFPGGVTQVVQNLIDCADRAQSGGALLLVNTWGPRSTCAVENGRRVVRMMIQGPIGDRRPLRHFASFVLRLPSIVWRLRQLVRRESIAQINVHYPGLDCLTWVVARSLLPGRPPLVLSFHGSDYQHARSTRGLRRWLWRHLLGGADDITVCSRSMLDEMRADFGTVAERARLVDNGVDPQHVAALAAAGPAPNMPRRYIASLATFEHKKGLDVLIAGFGQIASLYPDLDLVIAGRLAEPDYHRRLLEQGLRLGCAGRIHLLVDMPHAEAMRVLAGAELFVLPSRREPFGIVILEAAVLGIPVVATDVCGAVQRLSDTASVAVIPPDRPDDLARTLERWLEDPAQAHAAAEVLRRRVLQEFNWERIAAQYDFLAIDRDDRVNPSTRTHP
jgi:glycosyltransferase involved in cell wall biosynthesis